MDDPLPETQQGDILIVDDEMANLRVLSRLLTDRGYQVRSARDGVTALMIAGADPPDLILLDVKMPGMDGIEVCRQLKRDPVTCDIPVIFVSGLDEVADQVRGFEAGGVDYITKPFQLQDVEARVQTHLKLHHLQSALQERNKDLRDRVRELLAINRIANIFATTANLHEALASVAAIVTELFDNRLTMIMVQDEEGHELQVVSTYERDSGFLRPETQVLPLLEMPLSLQAMASGQPDILTGVPALELPDVVRTLIETYELHVVALIPLLIAGKSIGTMTISLDEPEGEFSDEKVILAETIAGEIAAAIEHARLAEQARIAAVDAERQRLARELHDSVTQSLYSVILLSSGWQSMAEQGTLSDPAASFRQLGEVGLGALREMRLLIHQLRPPVLEEIGLVRSLQQRLDFVELRADIEPELKTRGDVDNLPPTLEDQLFHIAQEALNNTLRHAQASEVSVWLQHADDQVVLTIHDNGKGFFPSQDSGGLGLKTMRERTESLRGTMEIATGPDCDGTTVTITVPLETGRT